MTDESKNLESKDSQSGADAGADQPAQPEESAAPEQSSEQAAPRAADESAVESAPEAEAKPQPERKPTIKPAPAAPAASVAETEVTRRGFFSWAAVAWVGFTAAIGGCMTAFGRFMFPNVLYEPPNSFKVGVPEDFPEGVVDERFKESNGVFIVNNEGELYALFAVCTHLGCPPAWLDAQNKFKCPCHGSGYYKSGINFEGPTPRPLERAKIAISPDDGQIVVDKGQKFQWELGQWEDPNSYIALG